MARTLSRIGLGALIVALLLAPATARAGAGVHGHGAHELDGGPAPRLLEPPRAVARLAAPAMAPTWCGDATSSDVDANEVGTGGPYFKVLYAHANDRVSRLAAHADDIQAAMKAAQEAVVAESMGTKHLRVDMGTRCGAGYVDIQTVRLPEDFDTYAAEGLSPSARFPAIRGDLPAVGGGANLLVFVDELSPYIGGAGVADQPPLFFADGGGQTAMIFGDDTSGGAFATNMPYVRVAVLHEAWHTFGAVLSGAPNHDGTGHCTDRHDVLCFRPSSPDPVVCSGNDHTLRLDCNNDDYFAPEGLGWYSGPNPLANTYESPFLNSEPVAGIVAGSATAGQPVVLDASGSTDDQQHRLRYAWDLDGDGTFETETGSEPKATAQYATPALVRPAVRVTDSDGLEAEAGTDVVVSEAPPAPPADAAPTATPPPLTPVAGPPSLRRLGVRPRAFRTRGRRAGATVTFELTAAARVVLRVERRVRRRKRARWVRRPGRVVAQGSAGTNTLRFRGRLRGRPLKPGRYRLVATPAGGAPLRVAFVVLGRR